MKKSERGNKKNQGHNLSDAEKVADEAYKVACRLAPSDRAARTAIAAEVFNGETLWAILFRAKRQEAEKIAVDLLNGLGA